MILVGAIIGVIPDLDLVFTWILGMGIAWHAGFTHSVAFAVLCGYLGAGFISETPRQSFSRRWIALSGAMLSHGIIDWATKKTYGGAALLWPFERKKYKLGAFDYFAFYPDSKLDPLWKLALRAVEISFYELLIFGALFALILAMRSSWDGALASGVRR
jgi:membrane-bound metal-dependent hydrolase YbcI (DUF457 family)